MPVSDWDRYRGQDLYDTHGDKIGSIDEVFLDDATNEPEWLAVNTGLFGMNQSLVPVDNVSTSGDRLVTPFSKDEIKDAPNVSPADQHVTVEAERRLYDHYGRNYMSSRPIGTDTSQRQGDQVQEMTATNEQVQKTADTESVRLRKHTWTEQVPVQREEIVVEDDTDSDIRR